MSKVKDEVVARLTVYGAAKMNSAEFVRVMEWLEDQIEYLNEHGPELAHRFTMRLMTGTM